MTDSDAPRRVEHDTGGQAYRLFDGDVEVSHAEYREIVDDQGRPRLVFHHTFTDPAHRGHGYADEVVRAALDDVLERDLKIVPQCWVVAQVAGGDDRYAALL
ncbi:MAG: GNAT family N-acetyltransferase [Desertimonas sp.]